MIGPAVWGGVLASPVIGFVVGWLTLERFAVGSGRRRVVIALAGLALGAALFGLAVGIADMVAAPEQRTIATLLEGVAAILWGVFMTGFVIALWPLAYGTYWLLTRLD
jgi:hypothetical protein